MAAPFTLYFSGSIPRPIPAVEGLGGKGLVELPQIDVVDRQPASFEQPGDGEHGSDPHLVGLAARDGDPPVDPERAEATAGRFARLHQDERGGAVGELGGIPSADGRPVPVGVLQDGAKSREGLDRCRGPVSLVDFHGEVDALRMLRVVPREGSWCR